MRTTRAKVIAAIALLIVAIFAFDRLLLADLSASALYVIPIMLTIKLASARALAIVTGTSLLATFADYLLANGASSGHLWADDLLSLLAQLTTAFLVLMQLRAGERERAMYQRAEAEHSRLALVHSIASATSSTLELDNVLKTVAESMAALFKADTVAILLADETGSVLRPAYFNSDSYLAVQQRYESLRLDSTQASLAESVRRRQVIIAGANDQTPPQTKEVLQMIGAEMAVLVPLFVRDRLIGGMTMAFGSVRAFNNDDLVLVETIGNQVAIAIENAQLFGNANKQREQLALINEIGQVFASTLDLQSIYLAMRERLKQIIDCDSLLVSFYDNETETIRCGFAYADGEVLPTDKFEPLKLGKGPQSECIRTASPIIVNNVVKGYQGTFRYVGNTDNNPLSIIHVPMIAEERVIGVIQAQSLRECAYSRTDAPLLSIIANQAAIAIENARLYRDAIEGRRALERANQMKDEFLAMLSHELRTPLTPILGWTRILSRLSPADHETRAHALEVIERNTRLQTQLVNDLLDLSRIDSGKISIYTQPTDLNAAAQAAIESMRNEAENRGINIEARFAASDVMVKADPSRLEQIINNLLTNAVKFTDKSGRITVATDRVEGSGVLIVSDTGIGIAHDFLPYVFDKFRQADSSTRRRHSGLGLGLSIVKSLVDMHGGEVSAHSEGPGHGATFTVHLPMAMSKAMAAPFDEPGEAALSATHKHSTVLEPRLLIIEDDADTLEMMRVICDSQRMKVLSAGTAEEAFTLLEQERPDVIISDIMLPGMDGHELARRLRSDNRLNRIPMIAITGLISDHDRKQALSAGFDAHLPKPVNYGELFELVRRLTKERVASSD